MSDEDFDLQTINDEERCLDCNSYLNRYDECPNCDTLAFKRK